MRGYGVDLITFYHPDFWKVSSRAELVELGRRDPERIWVTILKSLEQTNATSIEMTFAPADIASATKVFGSAVGFRTALAERGLRLKSTFYSAPSWGIDADIQAEVDRALEAAEFISAAGGDTIVIGPAMRRSWDAGDPFYVDLAFAQRFAATAHPVGQATLRHGVKIALHTEGHSSFCTSRDIALLLMATDPEYVYFCPDTAHILLSGGDPVEILRTYRERVVIAHWKDAVGPMPEHMPISIPEIHAQHYEYMRPMGMGQIDWTAWATTYESTADPRLRLLELDAAADPVAQINRAQDYLQRIAP